MLNFTPKWHDPSQDELSFANELLEFHFQSALEDLVSICQRKNHSETGKYSSFDHGMNPLFFFFPLGAQVEGAMNVMLLKKMVHACLSLYDHVC